MDVEIIKEEFEVDEKVKKHATTYLETIIHFVKAGLGAGRMFEKFLFAAMNLKLIIIA